MIAPKNPKTQGGKPAATLDKNNFIFSNDSDQEEAAHNKMGGASVDQQYIVQHNPVNFSQLQEQFVMNEEEEDEEQYNNEHEQQQQMHDHPDYMNQNEATGSMMEEDQVATRQEQEQQMNNYLESDDNP